MKNLIQDTLNRIKAEHIAPEPRWKFLLKKIALWAGIGLAAFLGSFVLAMIYFFLSQLDWDLYRFTRQNPPMYFLSIIPYFWIVFLLAFLAAAYFGVRRTETGYRFNWFKIILVILAGVVVFGFLISFLGFDRRFNNTMMHRMPYYAQNIETKETQWMQPEQGLLAGVIKNISQDGLELRDLGGADWKVEIDEKTFVRPMARIERGEMVKIIGKKKTEAVFEALEIRPWTGRGEMMGPGSGRGMMR